jgi:predicted Ser/Thr protein kinase
MSEQDPSQSAPAPAPVDELERERVRAQVAGRLFGQAPAQVRVGRYVVQGAMGQGATGIVYRAFDEQLHRMVALKLLNGAVAQTDQHRERLMREARAMAQLSHPNVALVHEIGWHEGRHFIAMELLEGGTLGQWSKAERRDWREIVRKLLGIGRGLEAAHRHGLVHRDLKPDNILIGSDGRPRIVDFGLVGHHLATGGAPATQLPGHSPVASMTLTATGALLGTPAYMAPEQLMGQPATVLSDQFAFCVTAYEALFGQRPFHAENVIQLVNAVTTGQTIPPPSDRGVPGIVTKAILRGLEVDPQRRHRSMSDLCAVFEGALGPGRGAQVAAVVTSLVFMGAVGAAGYAFWSSRDEPESGASEEVLRQEAKARALSEAGKYQECLSYAESKPASYELMTVAVTCASRMRAWDRARALCERWRAADTRAPPDVYCHPAMLKHNELFGAGKFEECYELARRQPERALFLENELTCAVNVSPAAFGRACERMRARFPNHVQARACPGMLEKLEKE